jgi:AraC-like DNA-binding protein
MLAPLAIPSEVQFHEGARLATPGRRGDLGRRFFAEDSPDFRSEGRARNLSDAAVALVEITPRRDDGPWIRVLRGVHVGFVLNGTVRLGTTPQSMATFRTGSMYCILTTDTLAIEGSGPLQLLDIRLSSSRLRDRGVWLPARPIELDANTATAVALRLFAHTMLTAPRAAAEGAGSEILSRIFEDLVIGTHLDSATSKVDNLGLRAALRARAALTIAAHHHESDLTPTRIAAHLGVSLRHLQRAYEGTGVTAAHTLLGARTDTAIALLHGRGTHGITMAEIANRSGFASTFRLRTALRIRSDRKQSTYSP